MAKIINRTPSAVANKLVNLASLDPVQQARGIKGAKNSNIFDRQIWNEFYNNWDELPFLRESILAKRQNKSVEEINGLTPSDFPQGKTREVIVKSRINQSFFRSAILAAYDYKCCITGLETLELVIAGHIKPWSNDIKNRMNPRNGIAINALHDVAFEKGLISISPDYRILISPKLKESSNSSENKDKFFLQYDGKEINLPTYFLPDPEFLRIHNQSTFQK